MSQVKVTGCQNHEDNVVLLAKSQLVWWVVS